MKRLLALALLALLPASAHAEGAAKAAGSSGEAITAAAQGFFAAWNKHDVPAMAACWADDATLINPMGRRAHGKAEIEKLLGDEQGTVFKASTATLSGIEVTRPLGSGMAFCDGEMTVDGGLGPDGSALPQMKYHLALVMEKKGNAWKLAEARPYAFLAMPAAPAKAN